MILSQIALNSGGCVVPLIIDEPPFPSLMNPTILYHDQKFLINLRNVDYAIYSNTTGKFLHWAGPLVYIHTDDRSVLETKNIFGTMDVANLEITKHTEVDFSEFDTDPQWEFIGLEDARLAYWEDSLYLIGVRRDTETTGIGRMEMSKIINGVEVERTRIPAPYPDNTYCEKNWMPVLDRPFTFVKWCNPVEVVYYNRETKTTEVLKHGDYVKELTRQDDDTDIFYRGCSQLVPFKNGYLSIIHQTELWRNECKQKESTYVHRIVRWDREFNIVSVSDQFTFMDNIIEFCCGLAIVDEYAYITYGYMDNSCYVLKLNLKTLEGLLHAPIE